MKTPFSVVTIVKGRKEQLSNLIKSIERASYLPQEMVIVWMAPPSDDSLICSDFFPIIHRFAASEPLPIPKARNRGFESCKTDKFIYLDVDCICPETLLEEMTGMLSTGKVVTANVTLLQSITTQTVDIVLAGLLMLGGVIGAQFGSNASSLLRGEQLRGLLALLVLAVCIKLFMDLTLTPEFLYSLELLFCKQPHPSPREHPPQPEY